MPISDCCDAKCVNADFHNRSAWRSNAAILGQFVVRRLSGRTEARSGLRMMPPFPPSPLKFRTAGFPRYGFKAGLSDKAFPARWFAVVLRALRCHRYSLLCVRVDALISTSVRADQAALPQGPSLRSRSIIT